MRSTTLVNHLNQDEIRERMVRSKEREQYQRWQTIFLTSKGLQADIIAEYVGTTKGTVHQWVYQYNHDGPDGFTLQIPFCHFNCFIAWIQRGCENIRHFGPPFGVKGSIRGLTSLMRHCFDGSKYREAVPQSYVIDSTAPLHNRLNYIITLLGLLSFPLLELQKQWDRL